MQFCRVPCSRGLSTDTTRLDRRIEYFEGCAMWFPGQTSGSPCTRQPRRGRRARAEHAGPIRRSIGGVGGRFGSAELSTGLVGLGDGCAEFDDFAGPRRRARGLRHDRTSRRHRPGLGEYCSAVYDGRGGISGPARRGIGRNEGVRCHHLALCSWFGACSSKGDASTKIWPTLVHHPGNL